jgi:membrane protein required for colicin V production
MNMTYQDLNAFDWFLLIMVLFCILRGTWRGGISQIFGIVGVLGGFFLAAYYCDDLAAQLSRSFPKLPSPQMISFTLFFFLTWLCLGILGFWLSNLLRAKGLGAMDRVMGAGIGLGKAVLLAVILLSFLTFFFSPENPLLVKSRLAPHVHAIARLLVETTPKNLQTLFEEKRKKLEKYWLEQEKALPKDPRENRSQQSMKMHNAEGNWL